MPEPADHDLNAVHDDAQRWRAEQPAPPPFDRSFQRVRQQGRVRGILAGVAAAFVVVVAVGLGAGSLTQVGVPAASPTTPAPSPTPSAARPSRPPAAWILARTTWQLRTITDGGTAQDVTSVYPMNLTLANNTVSASGFSQSLNGPVSLSVSSIHFGEMRTTVADGLEPSGYSEAELSTMSDQTKRYLELLPTMTSYRLSRNVLTLSDDAGRQLTFTGIGTRALGALQAVVTRGDGPGETHSVRAVHTTFGEFRAAASDDAAYTGANGKAPAANTRVWVIEWKGTFSVPHSCPKGSKNCVSKGTTYVEVVPTGWPPAGQTPTARPTPTTGPTRTPFEVLLFDESAGQKAPDLDALGTPIILPPFV